MKLFRNVFFLALAGLAIWGGVYGYNQATDGFSIRQITSSLPTYLQFEIPILESQKEQLNQVLSQPFRYKGKGCQFYAFESQDGKYVLKFFKHKHLRRTEKIERRRIRAENLLSSCKLAYEQMRDETGIFFIHLNRMPILNKQVVLFDKLGLKHLIDLDDYEYVIQKKGILVKEAFLKAKSEEEIRFLIEELIKLITCRCEKGVADRDRSFVPNVAFNVEKPEAFFIDIGQFYEDGEMKSQEKQQVDLKRRLGNMQDWMQQHFPQYAPLVENYFL